MGFIDRLSKLSMRDIALICAGLGILILAPVTEHFMMRPSADKLLAPGFGSRKGIGVASELYEPESGGFAPGMAGAERDAAVPLSARDPSSLGIAPEGAVKPSAVGIGDAAMGAAKAAVSNAVRLAGAPVPMPKFQSSMRGLGMARGGTGASASSKAARRSSRSPGMAGGRTIASGRRILRQANRAPSKTARRFQAGPVAMAGYRGVSRRTGSPDGGAFEQLRAKTWSAASRMNAPGAVGALVRTAGESVEIGAGSGGARSDSSLQSRQGQAGGTLEQKLAGMRAESDLQREQAEEDFWKPEEASQTIGRSTIDNILAGGFITPVGENVAGLLGGTPDLRYACYGIVPGTEYLPPENQCVPVNATQPVAISSLKEEMISLNINGQCPCGWGRYTGPRSGAGPTTPGYEVPAQPQPSPTQTAIEDVIGGDSMAGASMNFDTNVAEAKTVLEGGDASTIQKAHEFLGGAVVSAEEIIKQVDIGINVVENSMEPLPPSIAELKTLLSGREQQVNAMSGKLDSMESREKLAETYSNGFRNACIAGASKGKNLTSPNCALTNTYTRLMTAKDRDEFNAVINDTPGTAAAHYPAVILWNCDNAARKIGGARGVLEEENKRIANLESLTGSLPGGLTDTKRSRDYLVQQISDTNIFLQNEPVTSVILGQVYMILTGEEIEMSLPAAVADADLRDAPVDPYMGFRPGLIELSGRMEQVEPEKNFSDAYINNPESGVEEPQDYFSIMRMSVRIDSIKQNMGAIKDNLGESMDGLLASAKDFIEKARSVDTSLMGAIPNEPSVTSPFTSAGEAPVTPPVTWGGGGPPGALPAPEPAGPAAADLDSGSVPPQKSVGPMGCSDGNAERKARIEDAYDVHVVDDTAKWNRKELKNLEGTLGDLPEIFHGKESLDAIARSKIDVSHKGEKDESVMGVYRGWEESVTLFDCASKPSNFTTPEHEFNGTLVHELTHSVQYYDPVTKTKYNDPYKNPLVIDYANSMGWKDVGYKYIKATDEWIATDAYRGDISKLPTYYAKEDALEDMAESVMCYYGNPEYLKKVSPERYKFIKERIFGGKEYKNNWKMR